MSKKFTLTRFLVDLASASHWFDTRYKSLRQLCSKVKLFTRVMCSEKQRCIECWVFLFEIIVFFPWKYHGSKTFFNLEHVYGSKAARWWRHIRKIRAKSRASFDPYIVLSETVFGNRYRLLKSAFKRLCRELRSELRSWDYFDRLRSKYWFEIVTTSNFERKG